MRNEPDREARRRNVLSAILRHYIASAQPVGSKAVMLDIKEPLSPATIRHVMAELEAEGLLAQPHTSAGRIPTEKAYRFYVDCVMGAPRLPSEMARHIDRLLLIEDALPEQTMSSASRILSNVSNSVGVALGPATSEKLLEHVKFVKLSEKRAVGVIVSKPELIKSWLIRLPKDFSQTELDRAANYLNTEFRGWSLRAIRLEISKRAEQALAFADAVVTTAARLLTEDDLDDGEPDALFVEGTAHILNQPEFGDRERIQALLSALEEKARLTEILNACLSAAELGVQVLIGRENPAREMQSCALIIAPLQYRQRTVGALAVVGPTRMEYDRAVPTVAYVAQRCSQVLSCN